jgi:glycosyltransferase involved in cell wall biosynthesis
MNVWVFNQFAGSPYNSSGAGERYHFIAKRLKQKYLLDVTIFAASYNHLFINQPRTSGAFTIEYLDGVRYCWVKVPPYSSESGVGRLVSWIIFMLRLFVIPKTIMPSPDCVIVSSMSMFPIYPALMRKLFSTKKKLKLIFEVRDIWPLTLIEMGGFSKWNPIIILLMFTEWIAYRWADTIVSVLPYAHQHIQSRVNRKVSVSWIPNGIELESFSERSPNLPLIWSDLFENKIIVSYAGAVGKANALEYFLQAHSKLINPSNFLFLILGTGPELDQLKARFENDSIIFAGKVPKKEVHNILCRSHLLFIGWHKLSIYRFGVSANKYADYMLARKPIISSGDLMYDPVKEARCGEVVAPEDALKIAEAIDRLAAMSVEQQVSIGENGYQYLLKNNSMEVISEKFYTLLRS